MKQVKRLTGICLPVLLAAIMLQACENDLNKVKQISALEVNKPVDSTMGVDLIYSDSAKVKAHVITPLMLKHTVTIPYYEMPKGIKIIFYDTNLKGPQLKDDPDKHIVCTIVADYAITSNADKIFTLRRHVVVSNVAGDTFKSEELIWDSLKKIIYSNQPCQLNKVDGTALDGTSFQSNEGFTDYRFERGKGEIIH